MRVHIDDQGSRLEAHIICYCQAKLSLSAVKMDQVTPEQRATILRRLDRACRKSVKYHCGVGKEYFDRMAEAHKLRAAWAAGYKAGKRDWCQGGPDNDVTTPNPYDAILNEKSPV